MIFNLTFFFSFQVDNSNILKVYDVTQHTWIYDTHFSISYGDGVFAENEPVLAQLVKNFRNHFLHVALK